MPSLPQENDVFRWVSHSCLYRNFINPGNILVRGHLSNLSSAFNYANKEYFAYFLLCEYLWHIGGNNPYNFLTIQVATPAADWNDVFDASEEGPACPNVERVEPISEDCLRLNVYTKKVCPTFSGSSTECLIHQDIKYIFMECNCLNVAAVFEKWKCIIASVGFLPSRRFLPVFRSEL